MIDVIVFSKNRACQLYNLLDTLSTSVKGVNNIFVQYRETNERYAEGYQKLRNVFGSNVIFIDEKEHGFATTLAAILANEVTSEVVVTETDDSFFINDLDVIYCARVLLWAFPRRAVDWPSPWPTHHRTDERGESERG